MSDARRRALAALGDPGDRAADRLAVACLLLAALVFIGVGLYMARGVSFVMDELVFFGDTGDFSLSAVFQPFGGHLTAGTRAMYLGGLEVFGASHLPFQLITLLSSVAVAVLVFLLVRREVGPLPALAAAVVLLFLGSAQTMLWGSSVMWTQSTAAGLLALLLLERKARTADAFACLALTLSVLSLEVGLAFSVGVGVWIVVERGGLSRRLWVAGIPIVLYAAWWIWASVKFESPAGDLENLLLLPAFAMDSAAASVAALLGLVIDFGSAPDPALVPIGWGRVALVGVAVLVAVGLVGRRPPAMWWGVGALLLVFWILATIGYGPFRNPTSTRYVLPVATGVILLLATTYRGRVSGRRTVAAIGLVAVLSLMVNLHELRQRGAELRAQSDKTQATMGIYELERSIVAPNLNMGVGLAVPAGEYLTAADRFGGLGWTPEELRSETESARQTADAALRAVVAPQLELGRGAGCAPGTRTVGPAVEVPVGGAIVSLPGGPGEVYLRRFATAFTIDLGPLAADTPAYLELPGDAAETPWYASARGAPIEACAAEPE